MKLDTQQSRVDALLRLVSLIVFIFGALMVYYTYQNSSVAGINPTIVPVYYGIGLSLLIVGFLGFIARFE